MLKNNILYIILGIAITSCSLFSSRPNVEVESKGFYPNFDWIAYSSLDSKLEKLVHEEFSIDVAPVKDRRTAESFADEPADDVIYEYNPDHVLQGAAAFVQGSMQKYMHFGERKPTVYVVEPTIKHLRVAIRPGNLISGRWGRYVMKMDLDVQLRDSSSKVLTRFPINIEHSMSRKTSDGRHPSKEKDMASLRKVFDQAMREASIKTAWQVRRAHMRQDIDVMVKDSFEMN